MLLILSIIRLALSLSRFPVGSSAITKEGLLILESKLAKFEIPQYYYFLDKPLPRTGSGKIFKRGLRQEATDRIARGLPG